MYIFIQIDHIVFNIFEKYLQRLLQNPICQSIWFLLGSVSVGFFFLDCGSFFSISLFFFSYLILIYTRNKHRECGLYFFPLNSIIFSDSQLNQLPLALQTYFYSLLDKSISVFNLDLEDTLYSRALFLTLNHCLYVVSVECIRYSVRLSTLSGIEFNIFHHCKTLSLLISYPHRFYEALSDILAFACAKIYSGQPNRLLGKPYAQVSLLR